MFHEDGYLYILKLIFVGKATSVAQRYKGADLELLFVKVVCISWCRQITTVGGSFALHLICLKMAFRA